MQFVSDYMKGIDLIALAALVASAVPSLYRRGINMAFDWQLS